MRIGAIERLDEGVTADTMTSIMKKSERNWEVLGDMNEEK